MRRPIQAANWKMHKTRDEAVAFVENFLPRVKDVRDVDVVLAVPFTALDCVSRCLSGSAVALAAQNVNPEEKGAFTGEIAPGMLVELGCSWAIVGHSERRSLYGESDELIARKAEALLMRDIRPIVCVGESLEERESDRTFQVLESQLEGSLARIPKARAAEIVVAYEPVWAIGTGRTATPEIAQKTHAFVRERLGALFGPAAEQIRIQYGGSVKPENVYALMQQPDIDGALVGGASLDPEAFSRIISFESQGDAA
jgi:triosephosphate isomerase